MSSGPPGSSSGRPGRRGGGGGRGGGRGGAAGRGGGGAPNNRSSGGPKNTSGGASNNGTSTKSPVSGGNSSDRGRGSVGGGGGGGSNSNNNVQKGRNPGRGRGAKKSNDNKTELKSPKDSPLVSEQDLKRQEEERLKKEEEAREEEARKAEEQRRIEAEKAAEAEAKARAKQQEIVDQRLKDSMATLKSLVDTIQHHQASRQSMNDEALKQSRLNFETNKKLLKTDLKKCTAFVKKIKTGAAWSMKSDDVVKDVASLNLSRYVEEVVTAILESKPKVTDTPVIVALTTAMHERYPEFVPNLLTVLWNAVATKGDPESVKARRVYLRLLTEFLLCGILTETKNLLKTVVEATGATKDGNYVVQDAHVVVAFSKQAGPEIFGITPLAVASAMAHIRRENDRIQDKNDNPLLDQVLPNAEMTAAGMELVGKVDQVLKVRAVDQIVTDAATTHCVGAYRSLSESLIQSHNILQKMEKRCEQDRLVLGTLTESREKGLLDARRLKETLLKCVENLSDVLAQPMPHLQEEKEESNTDKPGIEVLATGGDGENTDFGPFDDEETRAFYCDIPDFLTTIPPALLGLSLEAIESKKMENTAKYGESTETTDMDDADSVQELPADAEDRLEAESDANPMDGVAQEDAGEGDNGEDKETPRYKLTVLLETELPECHRREQIDDISERFCSNHGSSKTARKRLAKALYQIPHARLDLLPFYSRMTATVDRVWSDIAPMLLADLEQQFHGQAKFKKNQFVESRMRTARYIGELTKFRVAPPIVFLRCMRRCLDDFTGNNVDIACCLLETCGRFLFQLKHTNAKVTALMEAMNRLSKAKNLDERLQAIIKSAFFAVKPPQSGVKRQLKQYSPLESYLRYLLLEYLEPTDSVVTDVVKQLLRSPWKDPSVQCGQLVNRLMLKACRKGRYKSIEAIAAVVAGLRRRGEVGVSVRLVDSVIEELRWALEHPNFRDQQRTITYARLMGELFCRSQISGKLVLDQLYLFINLGHEIPLALREASKKMFEQSEGSAEAKLPEYNSSRAVAQTITEDEETNGAELEPQQVMQPVAVSEYSVYDPRVLSDVDPPEAAYRIKLVCTLLEVSARNLVNKANLVQVEGFLTALQRYLFTKPILPAEVEFALLDMFDVVDSQWRKATKSGGSSETGDGGFKRYSTWLESHNATVALEEKEFLELRKKRSDLEAIADNSKSLEDIMTRMIDQNLDEYSVSHMDDDEDGEESFCYSAKGSVLSQEGVETESENDEEEEEEDEEMSEEDDDEVESENEGESEETPIEEDDDFDEEGYARQLEEEAFERELRRLTMDALEKGKSSARKIVASDMISGSQVVKKKATEQPVSGEQPKVMAKPGVTIQLLRKGNKGKVEARELVIPMETNLAIAATKKDEAAARERDEIKLRVLQYEADSAEAEMTGGNVYLEQEKLQVIRNKPLSIEEIDRNFGTTRGDLQKAGSSKPTSAPGRVARAPRGGSGRGRVGSRASGRSSSGRTLV